MTPNSLQFGREAYARNAWSEAYEHLSTADLQSPLVPRDLELLATAAILSGRDAEGVAIRERAHSGYLEDEDVEGAARVAIWIGLTFMQEGEFARGGGWLAKAQRLLTEPPRDCVEIGYLMLPQGLQAMGSGDHESAHRIFSEATAIGERFHDRGLVALARHGSGRALINKGEVELGTSLLDEAMVEVMAEGVYPIVFGIVYCSVIDACSQMFDIRRGREWTAVLDEWSATQPDTTTFRGQCLVFRAEFKAIQGEWEAALEESTLAAARLSEPPPHLAAGSAHYQRGELHRLRGEVDLAEQAYTQAAEFGHPIHPGMALLRLDQGRIDAASASIQREYDEVSELARRCRLLGPYVEIMLALGRVDEARKGAEELADIAAKIARPFLQATADLAVGAVLLEEGEAKEAIGHLRAAQGVWRDLRAPYEVGRASSLVGVACSALGDEDTAEVEVSIARKTFEQLGAQPSLAKIAAAAGGVPSGPLTGREVEVLAQIAAGKTNRQIAAALVISEKTVARHVANIFVKLGVSSRAAATAYAVKNRFA